MYLSGTTFSITGVCPHPFYNGDSANSRREGSPRENFAIRVYGLPAPSQPHFKQTTVRRGDKLVLGGHGNIHGSEGKPERLRREDSFLKRMNWVRKQPVVFYDAEDKRAWLVDGASALLYLMGKVDEARPGKLKISLPLAIHRLAKGYIADRYPLSPRKARHSDLLQEPNTSEE